MLAEAPEITSPAGDGYMHLKRCLKPFDISQAPALRLNP
jgi:hypothetical protein